ncbi:hypothetical protein JCGZ_13776 [Jatropha curcas]|uniref:WLM domain-containing protein n=2 Tax=Jatropha curcas TaxID=180498 RepID=A0A067K749_JATCU|nr:hypothetical protein JCGZ_13776 [Jatropha curcas]
MNSNASLKDLGDELQKLTDVKPDTMKLIVPQVSSKGSKLLSPFSNEHSQLSLHKASILEGKSIRMMGVPEDEVDKVLQNAKDNLRIAGFDEEERRMKQRSAYSPHALLKLPQGPYTFCDFRTLQLPGIQLNPPASEALKRMHMLAADPGIVAIMNKHRWRVGIMTEMAPVGYVGVSPKCILGFNKNHGEEISLRLRTDDLKGFRKYESIKKTLLHELAHMVYSEHDANFYNLDKQLNQEAASLDWTKSRGHTLNRVRHLDHYEEEESYDSDNRSFSYKLGGNVLDQMASARASSVAAAYLRLANESANGSGASRVYEEPDPDDSRISMHHRPEANYVGEDNTDIEFAHKVQFKPDYEPDPDEYSYVQSKHEPDPDDSQNNNLGLMETLNNLIKLGKTIDEPDPDDSEVKVGDGNIQGPNQDNSLKIRSRKGQAHLDKVYGEPDPDESQADRTMQVEPDPDDDLAASHEISSMKIDESMIIDEPDPDDSYAKQSNSRHRNIKGADQSNTPLTESIEDAACPKKAYREPDPDESQANSVVGIEPDPDDGLLASQEISNMKIDEPDPDDEEIRRIQDPVAVVCGRLQKAVETLRTEVDTAEATATLQTLFKIIRNVIEHPYEMKFKRIRKANPIIQKNVANHRAALEILQMVGFIEDVLLDETGKAETCLVLKRNDPGLLWLAKSSLEACLAF